MKHLFVFLYLLFFTSSVFAAVTCGTENSSELGRLIADANDGEVNFWSDVDKMNLSFCIHDNFKKEKETMTEAFLMAVEEWEKYANVKFIYKPEEDSNCEPSNKNVLFGVRVQNSNHVPYSAKAFFPYDEPQKRKIYFKRKLVKGNFYNLLGITMHEIGHVLGFRHEHIHPDNPNICKEDNNYEPLTDYDSNSIMHYFTCGGAGAMVLSDYDKEGAGLAYPF